MANVTLLPLQPAERLNDWLNLADVHLLPQKAGAADLVLPSKLLGILASGRPVVASSPAASELGHLAEQAGLRVDPEDGAGFAAAVQQLVQAPALRAALGAQARQLVEQRYGQEAVLGELAAQLAKASAIQNDGLNPWPAGRRRSLPGCGSTGWRPGCMRPIAW
jgi:colanic acid biosynthesis glycosyl transferase WcaI